MARILAVGGAHIDRRGWLEAPHIAGASNPGRWETEPGGGVFNAARNLARLGHRVTLVAPRGGDSAGEMVARAAHEAGINDCPVTFLDRATPSYTAILEPDGNLVTALADMALYELLSARRLLSARFRARLATSDFVLCDANLPAHTIQALAATARQAGVPVAAMAISPAKAVRLREGLADFDLVCMNSLEATALTGRSATSLEDWPKPLALAGLRGGLVSAGAGAVTAYMEGRGAARLDPPRLDHLADVTGAGDALASGFIDGLLCGLDLAECLARGVAAAQLNLHCRGAVRPDLTAEMLARARASVPSAIPMNTV